MKISKPALAKSISIAEGVSSIASIGAVWLMERNHKRIEPARNFIAEHMVYPCMKDEKDAPNASGQPSQPDPVKMEKARKRASVLLKGIVMIGTGFATFLPTQMWIDGQFNAHELKQVVAGKSLGLVATLVSMGVVGKLFPGVMEKVENAAAKYVTAPLHLSDQDKEEDKHKGGLSRREETHLAKLAIIEIPSSIISGFVNYELTHRMAR